MKCTTCDATVDKEMMFCPNCGARIVASNDPAGDSFKTISLPRVTESSEQDSAPTLYEPTLPPQPASPPPSQPTPYTPPAPTPYMPSAPYSSASTPQAYVPAYTPVPTTRTSTAAIVSLVCGILGWLFLYGIGPIAAVIAGHMARNEIRQSNGDVTGSGMATVGLILGYIQLVLAIVGCVAAAIALIVLSANA